MKKSFIILLLLVVSIGIFFGFTACVSTYNSKPGRMDELCGTYKLTKYENKPKAAASLIICPRAELPPI